MVTEYSVECIESSICDTNCVVVHRVSTAPSKPLTADEITKAREKRAYLAALASRSAALQPAPKAPHHTEGSRQSFAAPPYGSVGQGQQQQQLQQPNPPGLRQAAAAAEHRYHQRALQFHMLKLSHVRKVR